MNIRFFLCLTAMLTVWEATKTPVCIFCQLSNLTISVWPQAFSLPAPTSAIVLGNGQTGGRMEKKHVRLRALYFSYHSALKWNYNGGGRFPSNGERSTRGEGGRLAGREGGGRIYYTFISVRNDAERMSPSAVDQDHNSEWMKQRRSYQETRCRAISQCKEPRMFWCLLRLKGFSKPDTCWLLL